VFCRAYLSCRRSFILRKEISAARGWDKLITLGCVFIAAPLAVFAPEQFRRSDGSPGDGPVLDAGALVLGVFCWMRAVRSSYQSYGEEVSTLVVHPARIDVLLFVCMMHIPNALADPKNRFAWAYALRDLSFAGGAWALAGLHSRASSPQQSKWMILLGRIVIAIAAIFFAVEFFLHLEFAPGFSLEKITPSGVPFPSVWGYLTGAILLAAGIGLALTKKSRMAAISIGAH
jgi:hypothetical protein